MNLKRTACGLVAVAVLTSGCGDAFNDTRGKGDAPVGSTDDSGKEVINFPNSFSNVAHGCDGHGHRLFVTTSDGGKQMTVIDDPSCPGGTQG